MSREQTDLLPCPFCGSRKVKMAGDDKVIAVVCGGCEAIGPDGYSSNGIEWNTRAPTVSGGEGWEERAVMVCPQCEGEGSYADGLDEAACSMACTRCGGNGWIVDLALIAVARGGFSALQASPSVPTEGHGAAVVGNWIDWTGGENPAPGKRVDVRLEDGEAVTMWSDNCCWANRETAITAYRLAAISDPEQVGTSGASEPNTLPTMQAKTAVVGDTGGLTSAYSALLSASPGVTVAESLGADRWSELERLAKAATRGPWTPTTTGGKAAFIMAPHEDVGSVGICRMDWTRGPHIAADNAAFIAAADPQAILALIADARRIASSQQPPVITGEQPGMSEANAPIWPVGSWLSAALDDPCVCGEMKRDIREWFDGGGHLRSITLPDDLLSLSEAATQGKWHSEEIDADDPEWGACELWAGPAPDDQTAVATMVCGVANAKLAAASVNFIRALAAKQGGKS